MVESVFLEKDLAGRRNTAIHNVPAFQSGRASWLDNLDRLGAIYDGALLAGLLEACSRNRNFDQLILVVSDYDVSMRKRIISPGSSRSMWVTGKPKLLKLPEETLAPELLLSN